MGSRECLGSSLPGMTLSSAESNAPSVIAVTDSPFPSLDPVKAALATLDPDLRMAKSASADDIIAVARDADAVIVCYAQITAAVAAPGSRAAR